MGAISASCLALNLLTYECVTVDGDGGGYISRLFVFVLTGIRMWIGDYSLVWAGKVAQPFLAVLCCSFDSFLECLAAQSLKTP